MVDTVHSVYAERLHYFLCWLGLPESVILQFGTLITLGIIILLSIITNYITKGVIVQSIKYYIEKSANDWDDIFLERRVFHRLAHFAPALVIHYGVVYALSDMPKLVNFIQESIYVYMIIVGTMVINSFLKAVDEIFNRTELAKNRPIKGYIQLVNILVVIISILMIYASITGNEVKGILTGLGAMAAVLMLVFKDTILGLTASIQLSSNNMVKIGDWITMPSRGADGTVLEITLNTVKVQNGDKTISTIPTYAMVTESFTNWRGMEEAGGRRIKRFINIDMHSVRFCTPEMLERFKKITYVHDYINEKEKELADYNADNHIDNKVIANIHRVTNIEIFRKYMEAYLRQNPKIRTDMTFVVRELQPSDKGMPIEIYVFSKDVKLVDYENVQSDIFDHVMAVLPEFDLKVFQTTANTN